MPSTPYTREAELRDLDWLVGRGRYALPALAALAIAAFALDVIPAIAWSAVGAGALVAGIYVYALRRRARLLRTPESSA